MKNDGGRPAVYVLGFAGGYVAGAFLDVVLGLVVLLVTLVGILIIEK